MAKSARCGSVSFPDSQEPLLKITDVMELLGLGDAAIRRKVYRGELPAIRLNKSVLRFRRSEIEAYLDSKKAA